MPCRHLVSLLAGLGATLLVVTTAAAQSDAVITFDDQPLGTPADIVQGRFEMDYTDIVGDATIAERRPSDKMLAVRDQSSRADFEITTIDLKAFVLDGLDINLSDSGGTGSFELELLAVFSDGSESIVEYNGVTSGWVTVTPFIGRRILSLAVKTSTLNDGEVILIDNIALSAPPPAAPGEVWSGYDFEFAKPALADWTQPENQDRITDTTWLTRKTTEGLFNIAREDTFERLISPIGTEWAFGTTDDLDGLEFHCWTCLTDSSPPSLVSRNAVVHLIDEAIYIDIRFTEWAGGGGGGGAFAYVRGARPCKADVDGDGSLTIFDFLEFQNLFGMGDLAADFDGDGVLTLFDFLEFQNLFDAGCG